MYRVGVESEWKQGVGVSSDSRIWKYGFGVRVIVGSGSREWK